MNPYDWNIDDLFNDEPPKKEPVDAASENVQEYEPDDPCELPIDADDHAEPLLENLLRDEDDEAESPVDFADVRLDNADAHIDPADLWGTSSNEPQPGQPVQNARPASNDSYYASGPAYTARPAQNYTPSYQNRTVQQPVRAEKKRSGGFWKKAVALALVCALLGGAAGVGGALLVNHLSPKQSTAAASPNSGTSVQVAAPRESTELNVVTVDSGKLMTASQVYKTNVNSTVGITTEITTTNWWGYQSTAAAAGSGFILTEDG